MPAIPSRHALATRIAMVVGRVGLTRPQLRRHIVGCITLRQKFVPLPVLTLVVCRGRAATAPAQYGSLPQGEMDDGKVRRCPAPKSPNAVGGVALRCVVPCGGPLDK
eukprot:scaffold42422_cov57-Phaeocystis_antarctica.AAC.2